MTQHTAPTLNLIGAGHLGRTLAHLWHIHGIYTVQAVHTRSTASAQAAVAEIGAGQAVAQLAQMPPAHVWLLAVPDGQISAAAHALAALHHSPAIAWHASGYWSADLLAPLAAQGWHTASTHPAFSFAQVAQSVSQFPGTLCALEGDAIARTEAERAYHAIGAQCFTLAAAAKPLYHAAAVLASNFLPVLHAAASELWQHAGVPAEYVPTLSNGFVQRAAANLQALGSQAALTGPAARGDTAVVQAQTTALTAHDATLGEAYAALSTLAARLAQHGKVIHPENQDSTPQ